MGNDIHRMQEVGHGLYARNAADLLPCLSDIFGILFLDGETAGLGASRLRNRSIKTSKFQVSKDIVLQDDNYSNKLILLD